MCTWILSPAFIIINSKCLTRSVEKLIGIIPGNCVCPVKGVVGTNITIKVLCGVMTDTTLGDPYARYAAVARLMMNTFSMKCMDASFDTYLSDMTNTSWDGPAAGGGEYGKKVLADTVYSYALF